MVSSVCPDAPGIPALSLLESVCYEQISFWVGVVAKNGGRSGRVVDGTPWTRLTASDFVRLLGDRYPMLALTERQVRYALNRLVDLGLVLRERWWQSECFRSHSWWALCRRVDAVCPDAPGIDAVCPDAPGIDAVCPDAPVASMLSAPSAPSASPARRGIPDAPPVVVGTDTGVTPNLNTLPSSSDLLSKPAIRAELTEGPSGIDACRRVDAVCPDAPGIDAVGMGIVGPHCSLGDSQRGTQMGIRARIRALASCFCPDAVVPVSPSGVIVRGRLLRVDDGACAPLR